MTLLVASLRNGPYRMDDNTVSRSRGVRMPRYDPRELKHNEEFNSCLKFVVSSVYVYGCYVSRDTGENIFSVLKD